MRKRKMEAYPGVAGEAARREVLSYLEKQREDVLRNEKASKMWEKRTSRLKSEMEKLVLDLQKRGINAEGKASAWGARVDLKGWIIFCDRYADPGHKHVVASVCRNPESMRSIPWEERRALLRIVFDRLKGTPMENAVNPNVRSFLEWESRELAVRSFVRGCGQMVGYLLSHLKERHAKTA